MMNIVDDDFFFVGDLYSYMLIGPN